VQHSIPCHASAALEAATTHGPSCAMTAASSAMLNRSTVLGCTKPFIFLQALQDSPQIRGAQVLPTQACCATDGPQPANAMHMLLQWQQNMTERKRLLQWQQHKRAQHCYDTACKQTILYRKHAQHACNRHSCKPCILSLCAYCATGALSDNTQCSHWHRLCSSCQVCIM
jgi:hypothetical protein